jgi:hypothetical protein
MQRAAAPSGCGALAGGASASRLSRGRCARRGARAAAAPASAALQSGSHTQLGTSRKQNEDRWVTQARRAAPRRALASR